MSKTPIIPNVDNLMVSPNEFRDIRYVINRNLKRLLENDIALDKFMTSLLGDFNISQYIKGKKYEINDLVWITLRKVEDQSGRTRYVFTDDEELKTDLGILRCIQDENTNTPTWNDAGTCEESGWKDENEIVNILDMGLRTSLRRYLNSEFNDHVDEYHPLGRIEYRSNKSSDKDYIDNKILRNDFSNLKTNRETNQFPYKTAFLSSDNTILQGFYRLYDNGLIEYDIVFRMGYVGTEEIDGIEMDVLSCNNVKFLNSQTGTEARKGYTNNADYFYSYDDFGIFAYENIKDDNYSTLDNTVQRNRNDYVNTYFADIKFPIQFKDRNYMVFTSDITRQDHDIGGKTTSVGMNSITFCNKSKTQITAIYVTVPNNDKFHKKGYNTQNGGITANTFHCRIVGRVEVAQ